MVLFPTTVGVVDALQPVPDKFVVPASVELKTKILSRGAASYTYFDQARAVRE